MNGQTLDYDAMDQESAVRRATQHATDAARLGMPPLTLTEVLAIAAQQQEHFGYGDTFALAYADAYMTEQRDIIDAS